MAQTKDSGSAGAGALSWLHGAGRGMRVALALVLPIAAALSTGCRKGSESGGADAEIQALEAMFNNGEYKQMADKASGYVRRHPDSFQAWSHLGWADVKLDRFDEAKGCFATALELNPKWDNAYVGLGVLYRRQGNLDEARANYMKAIELAPQNAEAFSSLAVIELMTGNDAKAVEYGEKAWAIRKDNAIIAANLAISYHYLDKAVKRDTFHEHAKRIGYHNLAQLQDIIDGRKTIR